MNLKQIELFIAICESGSVTKAAEQLSVTQSTASQHLASLEDELGGKLFERTGRRLKSTPLAETVLIHALSVRESLRTLRESAEAALGKRHRTLSIVAGTIPGNYIIPPLIPLLRREFPRLQVDLRSISSALGVEFVAEGVVDLGVSGVRPADRRVATEEVGNDRIVLVVPPDHPFGEVIEPSLLTEEEFVERRKGSGTRDVVESALKRVGIGPGDLRVAAVVESSEAVKQLVMAGVGIGFISRSAVRDELERSRLREVRVEGLSIERAFYLVSRRGGILSPPAQLLCTLLRSLPSANHPTGGDGTDRNEWGESIT